MCWCPLTFCAGGGAVLSASGCAPSLRARPPGLRACATHSRTGGALLLLVAGPPRRVAVASPASHRVTASNAQNPAAQNPNNVAYWRERGWSGRPTDWRSRYAATKQQAAASAPRDNRARQLNPACTAWWTSQGWQSPPWTWDHFRDTSWSNASKWPSIVSTLRQEGLDGFAYGDRSSLMDIYKELRTNGLIADDVFYGTGGLCGGYDSAEDEFLAEERYRRQEEFFAEENLRWQEALDNGHDVDHRWYIPCTQPASAGIL